jgi:hypothetical protein
MGEERGAGQRLLTTPGANAPPLLNQGPWERRDGRFHPREMPVYAIIYMKTQGLIKNSGELPGMVCR